MVYIAPASEIVLLDDPVDITGRLPGATVVTPTDIDVSDLIPVGYRSAYFKYAAGANGTSLFSRIRRNGITRDGGITRFHGLKTTKSNSGGDFYISCWQGVDKDRIWEMRYNTSTPAPTSLTRSLALLGYGRELGHNYPLPSNVPVEIFRPAIDVTSLIPADSVTTPTVVSLASSLPAGDTAYGVILQVQGQTGSNSEKILYMRKNGATATSAATVGRLDLRANGGRRGDYVWISVDGSEQIEMWWSSTIATTHTKMRLVGRFYQ